MSDINSWLFPGAAMSANQLNNSLANNGNWLNNLLQNQVYFNQSQPRLGEAASFYSKLSADYSRASMAGNKGPGAYLFSDFGIQPASETYNYGSLYGSGNAATPPSSYSYGADIGGTHGGEGVRGYNSVQSQMPVGGSSEWWWPTYGGDTPNYSDVFGGLGGGIGGVYQGPSNTIDWSQFRVPSAAGSTFDNWSQYINPSSSAAGYGASLFGGLGGGAGATAGAGNQIDWGNLFRSPSVDPYPTMPMPGGLGQPMTLPQQQPQDMGSLTGRGLGGMGGAPSQAAELYAPAPMPDAAKQGGAMFGGLGGGIGGADQGPGSAIDWSKLWGGSATKETPQAQPQQAPQPSPQPQTPEPLPVAIQPRSQRYSDELYGTSTGLEPAAQGTGITAADLAGGASQRLAEAMQKLNAQPPTSEPATADDMVAKAKADLARTMTQGGDNTSPFAGYTRATQDVDPATAALYPQGDVPMPLERPPGADAQTPATKVYPGNTPPRPQDEVKFTVQPGREGTIKAVNPRLAAAVQGGAQLLPPGYHVEAYSGARSGADQAWHRGGNAMDVRIIGPDGPIPSEGRDTTGLYTLLARGVKTWVQQNDPSIPLGYGGAFGTQRAASGPNNSVADLMHYDLGGSRGALNPSVQFGNLTPLAPGEQNMMPAYIPLLGNNQVPIDGGRIPTGSGTRAPVAPMQFGGDFGNQGGELPSAGAFTPYEGWRQQQGPDFENRTAEAPTRNDLAAAVQRAGGGFGYDPALTPEVAPTPLSQDIGLQDIRLGGTPPVDPNSVAGKYQAGTLMDDRAGNLLSFKELNDIKQATGEIPDINRLPQGQLDQIINNIVTGGVRGFMAPGQVLESQTPVTTQDLLKPAQDMSTAYAVGGLGKELTKNAAASVWDTTKPVSTVTDKLFPEGTAAGPNTDAIPMYFGGGFGGGSGGIFDRLDPQSAREALARSIAPFMSSPAEDMPDLPISAPSPKREISPEMQQTLDATAREGLKLQLPGEMGRAGMNTGLPAAGAEPSGNRYSDEEYGTSTGRAPPVEPILSPEFMKTVAQAESSQNPKDVTGSYKGLYQLDDKEFKKYGGTGSIFDPEQNTKAARAKMIDEGQRAADTLGRQLTPTEMYLVHQQGLAGTLSHLQNPDQPAWKSWQQAASSSEAKAKEVIMGNLSNAEKAQFGNDVNKITSRDYINLWENKYLEKMVESGQPMTFQGGFSASPR